MVDEVIKSKDELLASMKKATDAGDWKAVSKISSEIAKSVAAEEKAEKEKHQAALAGITEAIKKAIDKTIDKALETIEPAVLDVMDGVWYARDFGEALTTCKVSKGAARKTAGTGDSNGSYISRPEKSADLLEQVGSHVMFEADTEVTIDKVTHTMPAGTTLQQAFAYSQNGGWRNRVRMALLKEAELI